MDSALSTACTESDSEDACQAIAGADLASPAGSSANIQVRGHADLRTSACKRQYDRLTGLLSGQPAIWANANGRGRFFKLARRSDAVEIRNKDFIFAPNY